MSKTNVVLVQLTEDDRGQFIKDNQWAFKYGSLEEFGLRNDQFEEDGEIISRKTIEDSIDQGEAYRIMCDGERAGGVVIHTEGDQGELDLLFTLPDVHSKGVGYAAWCAIEARYPEAEKWELVTPYHERRNIHFYVNRCGFHITEYFNERHPDPHYPQEEAGDYPGEDGGLFKFEKIMKKPGT